MNVKKSKKSTVPINKDNASKKSEKKISKKSENMKLYKERVRIMKDDMIEQLQRQGKFSEFYTDLVEDYFYYHGLKEKMKNDITKRGVNVTVVNGNGFPSKKINDNIKELRETNKIMQSILKDLGIQVKEPSQQSNVNNDVGDDDDNYL